MHLFAETLLFLLIMDNKWRTRSTDKILEVILHFASLQGNSIALEGSCQSMVYRSVIICVLNQNK